ncbi:WYL domain-containing protein [Nonomuraea sp. PA05]|uniref:WYL domain-containing protein n=1 Tax=Nonomuraea sp. PA05 TaxID=2604466 RepID=UPI0016520635|nr:WYL domain-containing protein [Nonomuraea sp. PA05]
MNERVLIAIRSAVGERRHLEFTYKGLPRTVAPWALGVTSAGQWRMRALQVGGLSASGVAGDGRPRLFDVGSMSAVELLAEQFEIPAEYRRGDRVFAHVDIEL